MIICFSDLAIVFTKCHLYKCRSEILPCMLCASTGVLFWKWGCLYRSEVPFNQSDQLYSSKSDMKSLLAKPSQLAECLLSSSAQHETSCMKSQAFPKECTAATQHGVIFKQNAFCCWKSIGSDKHVRPSPSVTPALFPAQLTEVGQQRLAVTRPMSASL